MEHLTDFYPAFKQVGLKKTGGKGCAIICKDNDYECKTGLCKRRWTSCISWKGKKNEMYWLLLLQEYIAREHTGMITAVTI